jgi:cytochrome P450 family 109
VATSAPSAVEWPRWEDPAFYQQDPEVVQESINAARRGARIYRYEAPTLATPVWVLSKWEDCRAVAGNPELFCNGYGFLIGDAMEPATVMEQLPEWAREEIRRPGLTAAEKRGVIVRAKLSMGDPELENIAYLDPPRHDEVRDILMKALRPSLVRSLKPRIAEIAEEFLDRIEPGVEIDFVKTVGRIPATLMTELVGVPREMNEEFIEMASTHLSAVAVSADKDPAEVEREERLAEKFHGYIEELLADRRADGADGEDLVSVIARSELDGKPVPHSMAVAFVSFFINAGETTRGLTSHVALATAQRPEQRRLLLARPELVPNAIEETMRYYPINWAQCRTATEATEIAGQRIEQDDYLILSYAAANFDEDVYARPDDYDVTRVFEHDHLGWGYGQHACPGALLARTVTTGVWERVVARFSDWELSGAPEPFSTPFIRGMVSLPLRFAA